MIRRRVSCKAKAVDNKLSTGYDDPEIDLMDVPDLFGEDDEPRRTRLPQQRRTPRRPTGATPYVKDDTVRLPTRPEMAGATRLAYERGDVVTSGSEGSSADGVHLPASLHYENLALDVRYATLRSLQAAAYRAAGYNVLEEATHLHISFDPEGVRI